MRIPSLIGSLLLLLCWGSGCGKEIGDSCIVSSDCSADGDRVCIDTDNDHGGYCTVAGCDFDTCPDEAVCVRFFTGGFANKPCDPFAEDSGGPDDCSGNDHCLDTGRCQATQAACDPVTESNDDCSFDELCSIAGSCVPRSSEVRFCMRKCDSDGDCRDKYECRDLQKMIDHGGEPVLDGRKVDESAPKFCAFSG